MDHEVDDRLAPEGAAEFEEIRAFEETDLRDDVEFVFHACHVFDLEDKPGVELVELRLVGCDARGCTENTARDIGRLNPLRVDSRVNAPRLIVRAEKPEARRRCALADLAGQSGTETGVNVGLGGGEIPALEQPVVLEAGEDFVLLPIEAHGMQAHRGPGGIGTIELKGLHRTHGAEHELISTVEGDRMGRGGGGSGGKQDTDK